MSGGGVRSMAEPFVVAAPAGLRVRTRLWVSDADGEVLAAVGAHLGSLAGADVAARCGLGRVDDHDRARSRRVRKQALTAQSSSRWAGAVTRSSEDQCGLAARNLAAEQVSLRARVKAIRRRLRCI